MKNIALLALLTALAPAQQPLHLIPIPRTVQPGALQPIPQGLRITCTSCLTDPQDNFTAQDLSQTLAARSISTSGPFTVTLVRAGNFSPEMTPEGYTITPAGPNSLTLTAATPAGLFYAAQTLKQLVEGDGPAAVLHLATVRDWPAMKYRGLHDDLSRGPVPTLAFQKHLIQQLAAYKVNIYSPYFEHTQQYASNPLPAPPGGSISQSDAREISAFAARYHIIVIPEQEAFGHLRHTLLWEQYQPLAETPHGAVLTPTQPGSLTLIQQWFTELAQLYPGPFLHIGADETQDLGIGQTKSDLDSRGLGPVYMDFLERIETLLVPLHRRLLFWGDIAQTIVQGGSPYGVSGPDRTDPEILLKAPAAFKQNTIAVAWQYNPQPKGFARFLTPFTTAGFETWVATGVNNWSRLWPNDNDALPNIQQFVLEGQRQHSTGMLNTIWYDDGEALADNNWYGVLFGAAAAWQTGVSSIEAFQQSFAQVFHGDSSGALNQAQIELMKCHDILRNDAKTGDASDGLFWLDPWSKDGQGYAAKIRPYAHDVRLHAEAALTLIANARAANPASVKQELGLGYQPWRDVGSASPAQEASPGAPSLAASPIIGMNDTSPALRYASDPNPANAYPSTPTTLREPNAIDAMELGARRIDFLALKFQLADEMVSAYARAYAASNSTDPKLKKTASRELSDVNGVNGRLQDILQGYAQLRDLYAQAWLRTNRPANLRPILDHYDLETQLWQQRADKVRTAQRQYSDTKTLPAPAALGIFPNP